MARVRDIGPEELPAEAAAIYRNFVANYGPFRNQVAVFAHSPPAVTHLMGLLLDMRKSATIKRRYLELAIVAVSKLNECHYCVAHHKPMLMVEGLSSAGADTVLDYRGPQGARRGRPARRRIHHRRHQQSSAHPRRAVRPAAAPFQRGADRRIDHAHRPLRLLQPLQRRAADRRGRGGRTLGGSAGARLTGRLPCRIPACATSSPASKAPGRLVRVAAPVSPELEMTEIQTRLLAERGPAVLFENVVRARRRALRACRCWSISSARSSASPGAWTASRRSSARSARRSPS